MDINQLIYMAFYRNLDRVVSSQLFTKPNNFLLQSKYRPVYVQNGSEPRIEYLHSAKPLVETIKTLIKHQTNASFAKYIEKQLSDLEHHRKNYSEKITKFVSQGGLLTGEGIANVYFAAEQLGLSSEWLEQNIHRDIPVKVKFMSHSNLKDVLQGLQKYHNSSPHIKLVKDELASRQNQQPVYVAHQLNESSKYEFSENESNHPLISVLQSGSGVWKYLIWQKLARLSSGRTILHSD